MATMPNLRELLCTAASTDIPILPNPNDISSTTSKAYSASAPTSIVHGQDFLMNDIQALFPWLEQTLVAAGHTQVPLAPMPIPAAYEGALHRSLLADIVERVNPALQSMVRVLGVGQPQNLPQDPDRADMIL